MDSIQFAYIQTINHDNKVFIQVEIQQKEQMSVAKTPKESQPASNQKEHPQTPVEQKPRKPFKLRQPKPEKVLNSLSSDNSVKSDDYKDEDYFYNI